MKIAILLPGHLRAWEYCKQNFISNLYDTSHQVDVFVDTYNNVFRHDYTLHKENELKIIKENNEIISLFEGINVVDFKIENQPENNNLISNAEEMQIKKLLRITNTYEQYESQNEKYDLVVRSRFDILLDSKLDYNSIYENCRKDPYLIYIGNGAVRTHENDMFAICNTETFKIYGKRFLEIPYVHVSMSHIKNKYNINYSQSVGISIVRLGGDGESITYNGTQYKIHK